ncbi:MAG: GC-type dockerin domain-anchored protein, partial [Phycisphaerae bacterium]
IASDDAAAGNSVNNASYRRVNVTGTSTALTMSTVAGFSTQRTLPAIYGWTVAEPGVTVRSVVVPNEGTFNIAYKVTALANGMYHYEYMLHNLNSDRSAASFQLNLPANGSSAFTEFANVGFRDVESHSGEPYSNVDWTSNRTSGAFGWGCTQTFTQNANANALRWGTSYTFRFDSNMPPVDGTATIGLFKTGTPAAINVAGMKVPANAPCIGDFNQDGFTDGSDVSAFFGSWENADASADVNRDGGVDGSDVERFIVQWVAGC